MNTLNEWLDAQGSKVNINNTAPNTSSSSDDFTERFKKLAAHLSSTHGKSTTAKLTEKFFKVVFGKHDEFWLSINYNKLTKFISVILYNAASKRMILNHSFDSWSEVLYWFEANNFILSKSVCESIKASTVDEFKLYENLWN